MQGNLFKLIQSIFREDIKEFIKEAIGCYQHNRCYIDEYIGQRGLRESFFQNRDNKYFIFDVITFGKEKSKTINTNKSYWINRWLKRN